MCFDVMLIMAVAVAASAAATVATAAAAANWAQLSPGSTRSSRAGISGRYGHASVVVGHGTSSSINDNVTDGNGTSTAIASKGPKLLLLGGDDYDLDLYGDVFSSASTSGAFEAISTDESSAAGGLRNDIWMTDPSDLQRVVVEGNEKSAKDAYAGYLRGSSFIGKPKFGLQLQWNQTNPGRDPPTSTPWSNTNNSNHLGYSSKSRQVSYDEWIACQDYFHNDECSNHDNKDAASWKESNMWSPRRGHGAVVVNENVVYIIGGRARERVGVDDRKREKVVLKNDVWVAKDGMGLQWELKSPGCKDHQEDVLLETELWSELGRDDNIRHNVGSVGAQCTTSADCYGAAECKALLVGSSSSTTSRSPNAGTGKVCVCSMFGPREQHSVTVQKRSFTGSDGKIHSQYYIFVVGGQTVVRRTFCGDYACGTIDNGYRVALNDAWVSTDGVKWIQLRPAFPSGDNRHSFSSLLAAGETSFLASPSFRGRGGHSAVLIHSTPFNQHRIGSYDRLVIFGGETSHPLEVNTTYLNDVWSISLSKEACCRIGDHCELTPDMAGPSGCLPSVSNWTLEMHADWPERSGHTTIYEPPSAHNSFIDQMYVFGGKNHEGVLSDVWSWNVSLLTPWSEGFITGGDSSTTGSTLAANAEGITSTSSGDDQDPVPMERQSPWKKDFDGLSQGHGHYRNYLSVDSEVRALSSYRLPIPQLQKDGNYVLNASSVMSVTPLITENDVVKMKMLGITSIRDLADADVYTILKLRGIDNPWLEKAPVITNICYLKSLAAAFVEKCSKTRRKINRPNYFLEDQLLRNASSCVVKLSSSQCYGTTWNGCAPIESYSQVDVYGLGYVIVPQIDHDPSTDLAELHCRQTPPARYMASGVFVDNKAIVMGGRGENLHTLHQDVWTRDDRFPQAVMTTKPRSYTAETRFEFSSNEPTAQEFEYMLFDSKANVAIHPNMLSNDRNVRSRISTEPHRYQWQRTTADEGADVAWLDYRNGGPGRGYYTIYVRAIDRSGNRDAFYGETNVYTWLYIPKLPVGKIIAGVFTALFAVGVATFEYRRRQRKAALERYALKRARRKYRLQEATMQDAGGNRNASIYQWQRHVVRDEEEGQYREYTNRSRSSRSTRDRSRYKHRGVYEGAADEGDSRTHHHRHRHHRRRKHRRSNVDRQRSRSKSRDHRGKLSSAERDRERRRRRNKRRRLENSRSKDKYR